MEHLEYRKKIMIMIAIMSAMLFASINQTIIGTAMPRIISALGGMEYYSWIFTIYMLTSSIMSILVGKLSDLYGRKPFILFGIAVFTIGSFMSGLSQDIFQLIIYRGIQGIGAGMIMSTSFTAVGDLFSPRERGKWQGLMSGVFGLASVFGPTLGGWIVDNADWHWVFWIFLPFGVIAFLMIWRLFPSQQKKEAYKIDYLGSLMLTLTIVPLLLAFSWGGKDYDWASSQIIGLFATTLIALLIFILIERKAQNPVLPLDLFKNKIFSLSNGIGLILGAGMFGAIMYMPIFIQGVIGASATKSGFVMMPLTLSMVVASAIGGQIMTKTGKYKFLALLGLATMASGLYSISFMDPDTTIMRATASMIVVGFGLGLSFPVFTLTVQNAVEHQQLGVATASTQLFRSIGGTIGVSLLGTVMNRSMQSEMEENMKSLGGSQANALPPEIVEKMANPQVLMDVGQMKKMASELPADMLGMFEQIIGIVRSSLSYAITHVFLVGAIMIFFGFLLTFFIKEIPLRTSNQSNENETRFNQHQKESI
ncbi:EmrB/QacA subfamily drug resistance transporter [Oikeobacillus pervagus]|uniref:EmrB/QacA subfamily drug resistance transporter n=1 Tax=Oikeobacillus pervagus TaxID=1325931 RepID=A0AAJ1WJT4_9BACI|nr:MDR family MFS transporter [Oikeobacillus pervagus]MDQ0214411.1 EmrB/QacA subfamily drug resistance transporter [Oikeobacillus pervagus]